jgi:hypothetical protein
VALPVDNTLSQGSHDAVEVEVEQNTTAKAYSARLTTTCGASIWRAIWKKTILLSGNRAR